MNGTKNDTSKKCVSTDQSKNVSFQFHPKGSILSIDSQQRERPFTNKPQNVQKAYLSNLERSTRRILLRRGTNKNFGFCFVGGSDLNAEFFITSIIPGSPADMDGQMRPGDKIIKVNGEDLFNLKHSEAVEVFKNITEPTEFVVHYKPGEFESLKLGSNPSNLSIQQVNLSLNNFSNNLYIRAEFSFCPDFDQRVPGKGLSFNCGDILLVFNMWDADWWQAIKISQVSTEKESEIGFIPSKQRVEKRYSKRKVNFNLSPPILNVNKKDKSRRKTALRDVKPGKNEILEESISQIPTPSYHVVENKTINYSRPVFLMGAEYAKISDDLRKEDQKKYTIAISCTSRPPRENDVDGVSYHFMSKQIMMEMLSEGKFVEIGVFKNNLYGITLDEIKSHTTKPGVQCLLNVNPVSIERLISLEIHPIVIFVKLTSVENASAIYRHCKRAEHIQIFQKIKHIEETNPKLFTAIVTGCSYMEIYERVKETIAKFNGAGQGWITKDSPLI